MVAERATARWFTMPDPCRGRSFADEKLLDVRMCDLG